MAGHPNFWGDAVPQGRHCDREGITFRSSKMTLFNRMNLEHALPARSAGTSRNNWRQIDGERGQRLSDLYEKIALETKVEGIKVILILASVAQKFQGQVIIFQSIF